MPPTSNTRREPLPAIAGCSDACSRSAPVPIARSRRTLVLRLRWYGIAVGILGGYAALFVGWDEIARRMFPDAATATRHGLLTAWAAIVTGVTIWIVYVLLRRHHRRLSQTAKELTKLLESYCSNGETRARFENPHLVHCSDLMTCEHSDCPAYRAVGERCWQMRALRYSGGNGPIVPLRQCHECVVYRTSCPDRLTELGESFNSLMFMLEQEAARAKRMRALLFEKDRLASIGRVASGVAHEVGNPLSSISSIVQILKRGKSASPLPEQLDLIERHVERISSTIRRLTQIARPGADAWVYVDVAESLSAAIRRVRSDARAQQVEVEYDRPESLPKTYAQPDQLEQALVDVAHSALEALSDRGRLKIGATCEQGRITIRFREAVGAAAESKRRSLESRFMIHEPGTAIGLGLAASYDIVQVHGGSIDVEAAGGRGVALSVGLPVLTSAPGEE